MTAFSNENPTRRRIVLLIGSVLALSIPFIAFHGRVDKLTKNIPFSKHQRQRNLVVKNRIKNRRRKGNKDSQDEKKEKEKDSESKSEDEELAMGINNDNFGHNSNDIMADDAPRKGGKRENSKKPFEHSKPSPAPWGLKEAESTPSPSFSPSTNLPTLLPTWEPTFIPTGESTTSQTLSGTPGTTGTSNKLFPTIYPSVHYTSTESPSESLTATESPSIETEPTGAPFHMVPLPLIEPSAAPSADPTMVPSISPSMHPSTFPSIYPSLEPSISEAPTLNSTADATNDLPNATYYPGNLVTMENGLILSEGLTSRIIAQSGRHIDLIGGKKGIKFHYWPDGGDVFVDTRIDNPGGWVYVSNSEEDYEGMGGVGAITFDKDANVIDYRMVLTGTTMNCNGGRTHFDAWVSCEEDFWSSKGKAHLVDPLGIRAPEVITLGNDGGIFEAFAYDIRNLSAPHYFLTEDDYKGALRRFTPEAPDWEGDPWKLLTGNGTTDYLIVLPDTNNHDNGVYTWTDDLSLARENARLFYPNSEGILVENNTLYFVCKRYSHIFELDLDTMSYTRRSTKTGLFDGSPDQIKKLLREEAGDSLLYFTEDGGNKAGIHARDGQKIYTVLEGVNYAPETTGLAFTPDGRRMYFAVQEEGIVFEIRRLDGMPFQAKKVSIKHHGFEEAESSSVSRRRSSR